jgi:hypothetical protein
VRKLAPILAVGLGLLLARSVSGAKKKAQRSYTTADGGVVLLGPDPPGKLSKESGSSDAGPRGAVTVRDAGMDSTQSQLDQMRQQIYLLQQQLAAANAQAAAQQQTNMQLQALRDQLAQTEADRQQREQNAQQQRIAVQSAVSSLNGAQQQLMSGDTNIGAALDQAASTFTGQAAVDVQAAREALNNGDLNAARGYLNKAVYEAQASRY